MCQDPMDSSTVSGTSDTCALFIPLFLNDILAKTFDGNEIMLSLLRMRTVLCDTYSQIHPLPVCTERRPNWQ